ncbi:hypothetical protein GCM10025770_32620 [Viridibacterium curvum]|uniref:Uncharacterized protein n=1 Tax=Viridibacterium curvum TaxID=1101404 RepID=A0ABP9R0A7_9RHOO
MPSDWPIISYFNSGTATSRHILSQLEFVAREQWYELYRHKEDGSLWRLDADDKYQQRFLVKIDNAETWATFDATQLEQGLLLESRGGLSEDRCKWKSCESRAIQRSAFCVVHTYEQGVRK